MAPRKKKRVASGGRKFVVIGAPGGKVYVAPLSALGRPVKNADLNRRIAAYAKKGHKWCKFCGVFTKTTFAIAFGNGHLPD